MYVCFFLLLCVVVLFIYGASGVQVKEETLLFIIYKTQLPSYHMQKEKLTGLSVLTVM